MTGFVITNRIHETNLFKAVRIRIWESFWSQVSRIRIPSNPRFYKPLIRFLRKYESSNLSKEIDHCPNFESKLAQSYFDEGTFACEALITEGGTDATWGGSPGGMGRADGRTLYPLVMLYRKHVQN
jgi:hypothetical protein